MSLASSPSQIARRSDCGIICQMLAGGHGMWLKWRIVASGRRSRICCGGEVEVVVLEQERRVARRRRAASTAASARSRFAGR